MEWLSALLIPLSLAAGGLIVRTSMRVERMASIIEHELTPNGGGSLRDRVVRIEAIVEAHQINHRD